MGKKRKNRTMKITEESLVLTEEEISTIKSFIDKISSIPSVECVYILPLFSYLNKRAEAGVITLYKYNELLADAISKGGEFEEENKINDIVYKEYCYKCSRLKFSATDTEYYKYPPNNMDQLLGTVNLFYSTILYDKNNNMSNIQKNIKTNFIIPEKLAWDNVIPIENIDDLIKECKENSILNRTLK